MYPCIRSLEIIGICAYHPIIVAIKDETDKKRTKLLMNALRRIAGATFAQIGLEKELEEPNNTKEQNSILKNVLRMEFGWPDSRIIEPNHLLKQADEAEGTETFILS
jgi:hypothetical protein